MQKIENSNSKKVTGNIVRVVGVVVDVLFPTGELPGINTALWVEREGEPPPSGGIREAKRSRHPSGSVTKSRASDFFTTSNTESICGAMTSPLLPATNLHPNLRASLRTDSSTSRSGSRKWKVERSGGAWQGFVLLRADQLWTMSPKTALHRSAIT